MTKPSRRTRAEWIQEVWDRRDCVLELMLEGMSVPTIALIIEAPKTTIEEDVKALKKGRKRPTPDRTGAHATQHIQKLKLEVARRIAWVKLKWLRSKCPNTLTPIEIVRLRNTLFQEGYAVKEISTMFNTWCIPTRTGASWTRRTVEYLSEARCVQRRRRSALVDKTIYKVKTLLESRWTVPVCGYDVSVCGSRLTWRQLSDLLNEDEITDHKGRIWTRTSLMHFCEYYHVKRPRPFEEPTKLEIPDRPSKEESDSVLLMLEQLQNQIPENNATVTPHAITMVRKAGNEAVKQFLS